MRLLATNIDQVCTEIVQYVKRHRTIKHNFICFTDNTSLHRIVKGYRF